MNERLNALYAAEAERIAGLMFSMDAAHPVFGEGPERAPLMLIGEAPGREEAAAGRPFIGKAGRQLDSMLRLAGLERSDIFVTNAVKYRPVNVKPKSVSNRTPSRRELDASLPCLMHEIELVRPVTIATLGNSPLYAVARLAGLMPLTVGACHGEAQSVIIEGNGYTLFPLYHPASGIYNRSLIAVMEADISRLGALLHGGKQ